MSYRPPQAASPTWTSVLNYANRIESALQHPQPIKGDSWKWVPIDRLYEMLIAELDKLEEDFADGASPKDILADLADIGAFCMFLGERYVDAHNNSAV